MIDSITRIVCDGSGCTSQMQLLDSTSTAYFNTAAGARLPAGWVFVQTAYADSSDAPTVAEHHFCTLCAVHVKRCLRQLARPS